MTSHWPLQRVRTRLLAAFGVLLVAAIGLAVVGWYGMRSTQQALVGVEVDLLPNISLALELAQRTTRLAALARRMSDSASPEELAATRDEAQALLEQVQAQAERLRPTPALGEALPHLRDGVAHHLAALVDLTQRSLATQDQLSAAMRRLNELGIRLHRDAPQPLDPAVAALWSTLVLGSVAPNPAEVGRFQADAEALLLAAQQRRALPQLPAPMAELTAPDGLLALRQRLVALKSATEYLVEDTRANADELNAEVGRHVAELRGSAAERSRSVHSAVRFGEGWMLILAFGCLAIAVGAARYVGALVAEIESLTDGMTRLAEGDTAPRRPAPARRDELGALARSFEVFREHVLARQRLVAELREQRALLDAVHESLTDGLAVFDPAQHLLLWNRRFAHLLAPHGVSVTAGVSAPALFAALPADTSWRTTPAGTPQPLAGTDAAALAKHDHLELQLPNGTLLELRTRTMASGGSVTLATDQTTRRAIESQLHQAQKLEVLGQLTGGVAHDFNNYLGTMLGTLALLESELAGSPRAHAQWSRVQRAARSAAGLVRRLLAFARRQPLQAEWVPVDEMVEEMRDLVEYSAGEATVVQMDLGAQARGVRVDRGQLENALLNLVMNSAAAMPGGGTLTVRSRSTTLDDGRDGIELSVLDTGVGMSEATTRKVFEPFFTTKPAGVGSGLGLSIVYGFVKQSGGDILLNSQPGAGTCVTLRFPAAPRPDEAPTDGDSGVPGRADLRGHRVLLVDDDVALRQTLTEELEAAGAEVRGAGNVAEAEALLDAGPWATVLLSDICLGAGLSGLALAQAVAAKRDGLRVVLMSGLPPELSATPSQAWPVGVPFLQKPFAAPALRQALGDVPADEAPAGAACVSSVGQHS
ncbi:MAG TPA: ATP-binding protein [Ideonella sp.]|uniref:ATP-binding protein n=1 Tax=Ideonella sp. TaxID=1929293 RepID=UPI002E34EA0D|nr:ATP-binding protein [Ideonella sp.]HEX5687326.1 ATP-binding protein [Ideonella sp.]